MMNPLNKPEKSNNSYEKSEPITILKRSNLQEFPERLSGFIVLINKPANWTSFDVVKKIRHIVRVKKVGHSGTLDPFATGLLLLGVGKGTRQLNALSALSKSYRALIRLGVETDTYDRTGTIAAEKEVRIADMETIERAVQEMSGEIIQIPPMYSAKKKNGRRLYKLARQGVQVERDAVPVTIHRVKILNWQAPLLELFLHVSKGTYIRAYAHDLGKKLGTGAHLADLERLAINRFHLSESLTIKEFETFWRQRGLSVVWK